MMFKDDRLYADLELIELRGQYKKIGEPMPGWNWDMYTDLDDYKIKIRERLERLKAEKQAFRMQLQ